MEFGWEPLSRNRIAVLRLLMPGSRHPADAVNVVANEQPRPALVLAGGGSYGAGQVGMLRALCVAGITPGLIAGSWRSRRR
jgi:hypothetical protein